MVAPLRDRQRFFKPSQGTENFEFRNMLDFHLVGGADVAFKLSAQSLKAQTYKTPSPNLKQRNMHKWADSTHHDLLHIFGS